MRTRHSRRQPGAEGTPRHHLEGMTGRWPIIRCGRCPRAARAVDWRCPARGGELMRSDEDAEKNEDLSADAANAAKRAREERRQLLAEHRVDPELAPYASM